MIATCNGATLWLSTAAILSIMNFEVRDGNATAVYEQVNCVHFMCASGTSTICEFKIVHTQDEFLEVGGKFIMPFAWM